MPRDGKSAAEEKTECTYRILGAHGRDAESKSKEVLFVLCDHLKQEYCQLEIMIKRYQAVSQMSNEEPTFKKVKKAVIRSLTHRFWVWSLTVQGM